MGFGLAFVQRVLVENASGVELRGPDELLVVEQCVHADDAGVVLDVGEQLVAAALVEGIQKAPDLRVVGQVEHPLLRPLEWDRWQANVTRCLQNLRTLRG